MPRHQLSQLLQGQAVLWNKVIKTSLYYVKLKHILCRLLGNIALLIITLKMKDFDVNICTNFLNLPPPYEIMLNASKIINIHWQIEWKILLVKFVI